MSSKRDIPKPSSKGRSKIGKVKRRDGRERPEKKASDRSQWFFVALVFGLTVPSGMLYFVFSDSSTPVSIESQFEVDKPLTIEDFPDLLEKAPNQALRFAQGYDAANPDKVRVSLGLYERLLSRIPNDARQPLLVRIAELNQALADRQGLAFQSIETEVESLIKSGDFSRAIETWKKALNQFKDEDILAEVRENIRNCKALKRRLQSMRQCVQEAPSPFQLASANRYAREIGPLLRQGQALKFTEAYKDLSKHALRLKKFYRTRDNAQRQERLKATEFDLGQSAQKAARALEERQALVIQRTKNYELPYKSGVRILSLKSDRFTLQFKKSGRERIHSFRYKPELTVKVLRLATRPKSLIDHVDRLCFALEHQLFEEAKSLQNQLKSMSPGNKIYDFDMEKLKRYGDAFRGQSIPLKKGFNGSRYDFQLENSKRYLEDWTTPSRQSVLTLGRKLGLSITGPDIALQSEKFHFHDEAYVVFPAPSSTSSRCRVELRLDTFGRKVFYVAAEFDPRSKTYTLTRGEDPSTLSPMTSQLAIRPGVSFKLVVKDGKVSLEHGPRTLSCTARRFTNCQVMVRHLGEAKGSALSSSWGSFTVAGALQGDWDARIGARFRRAIETQILALQSASEIDHKAGFPTLSVDDPFTRATVSDSLLSHYKRAWTLYRDGQSHRALREFNLLLQGNGELAGAHFARGLILREQGRFDEALLNFDAAVRVDALFPEALAAKGQMLARAGRSSEATGSAQRALALWPDCADAYAALGLAAFADRHFEKALKALTLAQRLHGNTQIIADIRAAKHVISGPSWPRVFEAQSKHFIVRTDSGQELADETAQSLERAQAVYKEILGLSPKEAGAKQLCLIFESESDFREYSKNTIRRYKHDFAGLYSHRYRTLLFYTPSLSTTSYYRFHEVLYHEGFHAYADNIFGSIPVSLNEGLAQISEEEVFKRVESGGKGLNKRFVAQRLKTVKTAIRTIQKGHAPTVSELVDMSYGEFQNRNKHAHYALSRLLCEFMLQENEKYKLKAALQ
ncbi:MAG: tetratricopeptide repeat protein, partial [Planctomycetota bacterium]|nr:tetratricopeptide repeat protein [Planctomycetota bacterium]